MQPQTAEHVAIRNRQYGSRTGREWRGRIERWVAGTLPPSVELAIRMLRVDLLVALRDVAASTKAILECAAHPEAYATSWILGRACRLGDEAALDRILETMSQHRRDEVIARFIASRARRASGAVSLGSR